MAASINLTPFRLHSTSVPKHHSRPFTVRCSASKSYNITLLPGDGIGPEVISVAKNVLNLAGSLEGIEFKFKEMPMGGAALDLTGVPLTRRFHPRWLNKEDNIELQFSLSLASECIPSKKVERNKRL